MKFFVAIVRPDVIGGKESDDMGIKNSKKSSEISEFNICMHCNNELTDENWCKSRQKRKNKICDSCRCNQGRLLRIELKQEVINHYGGKCACCGITELKFLTIDHSDGRGSGAKHRKEADNIAGGEMHLWLKKNNFPSNFRILCWNCNLSIGLRGYCPHERI
jgi:hypothetical protein